ncbi:hypothetical protein [Pedobacter cryoconitis]|uniref:Uncharacterized protein n=1 Tax=Pedobacter cryoconitis TaxID=188932 RepID=A0A327SGT9_9SPHI|nr:hypothetical protein [Pedobacter cryoconitis]RAJ28306.1 hypothetical protein LY11_03302 [Pedobacter cryoconitis]
MHDYSHLPELKRQLLVKSCIEIIKPSDCKNISREIFKCLHRNISATTLKRFFGLAAQNHKFSLFTVNTLTDYVNSNDSGKGIHSNLPTQEDNLLFIKGYIMYDKENLTSNSKTPLNFYIRRAEKMNILNHLKDIDQRSHSKLVIVLDVVNKLKTTN